MMSSVDRTTIAFYSRFVRINCLSSTVLKLSAFSSMVDNSRMSISAAGGVTDQKLHHHLIIRPKLCTGDPLKFFVQLLSLNKLMEVTDFAERLASGAIK
jgi:hypothetical protein